MFFDRCRKLVCPVVMRDKIKVGALFRVKGSLDGLLAGICNRTYREPADAIGVIVVLFAEVLLVDFSMIVVPHAVNGRGIALKLHPLVESIMEDRADQGPLFRRPGFLSMVERLE